MGEHLLMHKKKKNSDSSVSETKGESETCPQDVGLGLMWHLSPWAPRQIAAFCPFSLVPKHICFRMPRFNIKPVCAASAGKGTSCKLFHQFYFCLCHISAAASKCDWHSLYRRYWTALAQNTCIKSASVCVCVKAKWSVWVFFLNSGMVLLNNSPFPG